MRISRHLRRLTALVAVLALASTVSLATLAHAEDAQFSLKEASSEESVLSTREIAARTRTSVVAIETETRVVYNSNDSFYSPFGGLFGYGYGYGYGYPRGQQREYTQTGAGSGVIISEDGYILTNNHVISGADSITVYVMDENDEETTYEATLVGTSESNDVAVLKIEATGLNAAVFGDSDDLEIGEPAVVIGNPMGTVHGSVTAGIISAKEHELTIDDVTISAIQTDAAVNPGNSGGALFDEHGNVVGVIYAKSSSVQIEGIGYAIPVNAIKEIVTTMINDPSSVQAQTLGSQIMLGITVSEVTEEISRQYNMPVGVYISGVSSMSAAERAGLQVGDIITSLAGKPVKTLDELNAIKSEQTPGDSVPVVIDRTGTEMTLSSVIPQPTQVETAN